MGKPCAASRLSHYRGNVPEGPGSRVRTGHRLLALPENHAAAVRRMASPPTVAKVNPPDGKRNEVIGILSKEAGAPVRLRPTSLFPKE